MQIDTASWEKLNNRLSATDTHPPTYPPIAVYLLVHTLTAGADIEASYVQTESRKDSSSTVWRNWVITDSLFVHTDVKFAAADYDQAAEDQASAANPRDNYVEPTVRQAWVRPLDSVTSLHIGTVGQLSGPRQLSLSRSVWYPIDGLVLDFADGSKVSLPGQAGVLINDRERSDQFLNAVRSRLNC